MIPKSGNRFSEGIVLKQKTKGILMQTLKGPFRADHVGSFLRPPSVKEAWGKRDRCAITAAQAKEVEDREIERIIQKQEEIGLKLATDGECRRAVWNIDFFARLGGCEGYVAERGVQFQGLTATPKSVRVVGKVSWSPDHPMIEHFKFLKAHASTMPKMTVPSPTSLHFRLGRNELAPVYPDLDRFFDDLTTTYRACVQAFYDVGCRYLQFDDTVWAHLCDPDQRAQARARGDDPDTLPQLYARTINGAIKDRPRDMVVTTHLCRGNFRSTWVSQGGYEPVAETLLAGLDYDGCFLEYDSERAGGFEPLRFLPKGKKQVVLGLVTSKFAQLENKDDIKRRIEEATKYVAIDQLCLSPQCGFASTEEGNMIAEDEQWAKLRLVVDIATEVWGSS
jgi:5-methyltetrahydropteroyltriglutamate--homocysteine methyltransferase